jgi:hypothetical protein
MEFVETILVTVAVIATLVRVAMIRPYPRAGAAKK